MSQIVLEPTPVLKIKIPDRLPVEKERAMQLRRAPVDLTAKPVSIILTP